MDQFDWLFIFILAVACILFLPGIYMGLLPYQHTTETVQIYSLNSEWSISGMFYLGSGTRDQSPQYTYYVKNPDGSYTLEWCPVKGSNLFMDTNSNPFVIKHIIYKDYIWGKGNEIVENAEFHVPNNTIVQKYEVN